MTADRSALLDRLGFWLGGRLIVHRDHAPHGRVLPYRRAAGEGPAPMTYGGAAVQRFGWSVAMAERGLGTMLLSLGLARAMADATTPNDLEYSGPCPELMRRCSLPVNVRQAPGPHVIHTGTREPVKFDPIPAQTPVWLDLLDEEHIEVHGALPMRFYLAAEEFLGIALPATHAPAPAFLSNQSARPFHVVFVAPLHLPGSDYGIVGFAQIARSLTERLTAPWTFSVISTPGPADARLPANGIEFDVQNGADITGCVDVFASAELVVGYGAGLIHLATLTERPDQTGPHVVGLHIRHASTVATTGRDRHHAANVTTVRDKAIATFAGRIAGWW